MNSQIAKEYIKELHQELRDAILEDLKSKKIKSLKLEDSISFDTEYSISIIHSHGAIILSCESNNPQNEIDFKRLSIDNLIDILAVLELNDSDYYEILTT